MSPAKKIRWAFFFLMPFLLAGAAFALPDTNDDEVPDVTARVARISFISGDAQIRRDGETDWERAASNLPIVEGDEIATDSNSRLEIQFDSRTFLRLSANAYLKITTLRDEGIAVSLPEGTLNLRVIDFDKDRAYFEIDAPKTTVSVEKSGMYRINAGSKNDSEVRVSVTDSGQARVFSENSGFTLRSGRSAAVQLEGDYAGEWETSDAARYADDFDSWALQRDAQIAKRLANAGYDKYYDRDIYGAEDLNDYGEWVYTKKYGYVWKPYRNSIASYSDWSPYRYGQWRWIPPYGWTWVNDEPWGWATYHHGRWVYDDGYWYWSPYAQNRARRSWWRPALVVISYIGSNVCWYPLPYGYNYYSYNNYYGGRRRRNTTIINNNTTVIVNPTPNPVQTPTPNAVSIQSPGKLNPRIRASEVVPASGVVTIEASGFGRTKNGFLTAPPKLAQEVLDVTPSETTKVPPLPTYADLNGKVSKDIRVETPRDTKAETSIKTGATTRESGISSGETLRKERMFNNRTPIEKTDRTIQPEAKSETDNQSPVRETGAIKREPRQVTKQDNNGDNSETNNEPVKAAPNRDREKDRNDRDTKINRSRREDNDSNTAPVYNPPPTKQREEQSPPPRIERSEPVRQEPKYEPPTQKYEPPPRNDPPPTKVEQPSPKQEPPSETKNKDG